MRNLSRFAILTTVVNWDLYKKSALRFPKGVKKYVIDGTTGLHGLDSIYFMMSKFINLDIDWLIMADEDVLFVHENAVFDTIDYMNTHDYIACGVRDGGQIQIRNFNPYVINTFFSIVNLKELKQIWNKKEIHTNQFVKEFEFDEELTFLKEKFDVLSLYEPYYRFYLWLRRKGKNILFLEAKSAFADQITTEVFSPLGIQMLYHTWYARSYGKNVSQTQRIDEVFALLDYDYSNNTDCTIWKDKWFPLKKSLKKLGRRILLRLKMI